MHQVDLRPESDNFQIMVMVLLAPGGHKKVMQAFDYVRAIMKERMRFQMMMASLANEPVEPAYQVCVSSCTYS